MVQYKTIRIRITIILLLQVFYFVGKLVLTYKQSLKPLKQFQTGRSHALLINVLTTRRVFLEGCLSCNATISTNQQKMLVNFDEKRLSADRVIFLLF